MTPHEAKIAAAAHIERTLKTRRVRLAALVADEANKRTHDERNLASIEESIRKHGVVEPLVVQKGTNRIVAGNGRAEALRRLGYTHADVVEIEIGSEEEFRAISIRLNRTGELAGWDGAGLEADLAMLAEAGWGNLPEFGFDEGALDELIAANGAAPPRRKVSFTAGDGSGKIDADDPGPDPVPVDVPNSRPGMVYQLGPHRLMCGDCRNKRDVATLFDGAHAQIAFTSPPYASQREYDPESGFMPVKPDEFCSWFSDVAENVKANLMDDGSWFVNIKEHCEDGERSLYVKDLTLTHARDWGWLFIDEFCWERIGLPGAYRGRFKNGWEPVFHFSRVKGAAIKFYPERVGEESDSIPVYELNTHLNTVGSLTGPPTDRNEAQDKAKERKLTTGIALPSNRLPPYQTDSMAHSAAFPVKLPAFFILAFTDEGEVVYDPFCGSGSTIIAAAKHKRVGYGMEISPKFCDLIRRRWTRWATENGQSPGEGALLDPTPAP